MFSDKKTCNRYKKDIAVRNVQKKRNVCDSLFLSVDLRSFFYQFAFLAFYYTNDVLPVP